MNGRGWYASFLLVSATVGDIQKRETIAMNRKSMNSADHY
jgi:hypothetical protein